MSTRVGMGLLIGLLLCGSAAALEPNEVLVLVNQKVPYSVALGRYYCEKRGIASNNLVALPLPEADEISQDLFDTDLREPLREAMTERGLTDQIRCILTMWGVPFRLKAGPRPPQVQAMLDYWTKAAKRAEAALAIDLERLKVVGEHFPASAETATDVEKVDDFFELKPRLGEKPPAGKVYGDVFLEAAAHALNRVRGLTDERKVDIGKRQILAAYFDAFGLMGLQRGLETMTLAEGPDPRMLRDRIAMLRGRLEQLAQAPVSGENLTRTQRTFLALQGNQGLLAFINPKLKMKLMTSAASVDSELSCLFWGDYSREGQAPNLLYWKNDTVRDGIVAKYGRPLMVARLDGPSPAVVMRMIKDAVAIDEAGLTGTLYVDLAGDNPKYRAYDRHLRRLARTVRQDTQMTVKVERTNGLFKRDSCCNAALYVGWHSERKYVPAFRWARGAVGFHISSWEAEHLRDPNSDEWVPRMLGEGVTATIGSAQEPFLSAFPLPEEFFALVLTGELTVCEAYWRACPHSSWRMMFFGDPLYNPFANKPQSTRLSKSLLAEPEAGGGP